MIQNEVLTEVDIAALHKFGVVGELLYLLLFARLNVCILL
jgi:hypothetical protein